MEKLRIRPIAVYLPQFHPIPENDIWWGKGFTEWTNVAKAKPLFRNHYQPHLPGELGYYDLRVPEVREAQAQMAQEAGIYGFCYYHYWFNGKRLLNRPIDDVLITGKPDFPFCFCWANESWSRRWLGQEVDILIRQTYSDEDYLNHINWLIPVFSDPRYIKINGRPVFIIYRAFGLPEPGKLVEIFKSRCLQEGIPEPYLIASAGPNDLRKSGFDALWNFEPQLSVLPCFLYDKKHYKKLIGNLRLGILSSKLKAYSYSEAKERMNRINLLYPYYPCSFVNWDNSPRRGENGIIIRNSNPDIFKTYLLSAIEKFMTMDFSGEENLIFINAWNEWAEGNHLEPDLKNGFGYLNALKEVVKKVNYG